MSKWCAQDMAEVLRFKDELLGNKDRAFGLMLAKETGVVESKREELCFFTN